MNPTVALPGSMTWMAIRLNSGSQCPQSPKGFPRHLLNRFSTPASIAQSIFSVADRLASTLTFSPTQNPQTQTPVPPCIPPARTKSDPATQIQTSTLPSQSPEMTALYRHGFPDKSSNTLLQVRSHAP